MSFTSRKYFQIDVHLLLLFQTYFLIICGPLYLRTFAKVVFIVYSALVTQRNTIQPPEVPIVSHISDMGGNLE